MSLVTLPIFYGVHLGYFEPIVFNLSSIQILKFALIIEVLRPRTGHLISRMFLKNAVSLKEMLLNIIVT